MHIYLRNSIKNEEADSGVGCKKWIKWFGLTVTIKKLHLRDILKPDSNACFDVRESKWIRCGFDMKQGPAPQSQGSIPLHSVLYICEEMPFMQTKNNCLRIIFSNVMGFKTPNGTLL